MNNNYNNMGPMPGPQPMPNQPMNNMAQPNMGYGYVQKQPFKFPAFSKDKASLLGYAGAVLIAIGGLLDFCTIKASFYGYEMVNETINYFSTNGETKDGALLLALAIVAFLLVHFKKNVLALIPAAFSGLILWIDIADMGERITELEGYGYTIETSYGPAIYVAIAGIALVIAHYVMIYLEKKKTTQPNMMYGQPMMSSAPPSMAQQPMPGTQPMAQPMNQPVNFNQPAPMPAQNNTVNYGLPTQPNPNNQYPNNNMM